MATRQRLLLGGEERTIIVDDSPAQPGEVAVTIDEGDPLTIELVAVELPGIVSFRVQGATRRAYVVRTAGAFDVTVGARRFVIEPAAGGRRRRGVVGGAEDAPGQITAPLAGVVVEVRAAVGAAIEAGTTVLVLEAMKMQNEVQMPRDGTITAIHVGARESVEKGTLLVEYDLVDDQDE